MGICTPKGMVFAMLLSGNGYDFAHFGLESSCFSRELCECTNAFIVSIPNELEKEKYANLKCILRNLFCCCSNLRAVEIIS